jgi:hypothetical protein
MVLGPWNGSGTTTFSAAHLGLAAQGFDLNPIMVVVARARLLPPSEADSIEPLAREMLKGLRARELLLDDGDPLLGWFNRPTAVLLRTIEQRICDHLIGERTITPDGTKLQNISGLAATFYVALFSVCRQLTERFQSSNPTWLRIGAFIDQIYNRQRLHSALAYRPLAEFDAALGCAQQSSATEITPTCL